MAPNIDWTSLLLYKSCFLGHQEWNDTHLFIIESVKIVLDMTMLLLNKILNLQFAYKKN